MQGIKDKDRMSSPVPDETCPPAVIEIRRGGRVESLHRAYACIVNSRGDLLYSLGSPDYITYLRSSAKPLQAVAVQLSGAADRFGLTRQKLAVIAGSHGGESYHIEAVSEILRRAGLSAEALQCGVQPPLSPAADQALHAAGLEPTALHHNCSGKHAGMLATAVHTGENIESYLESDSRVQVDIVNLIALMAGISSLEIWLGIDGCSAPVHALPMRSAALAFARLVDPVTLPQRVAQAAGTVVEAMRTYPEMVGADRGRICTELIRAGTGSGLIAKSGAEGYYAAAWMDPGTTCGLGLTVKIEDGARRARDPLAIAMLKKFGALPDELPEALQSHAAGPIRNHKGLEVGEITVRI